MIYKINSCNYDIKELIRETIKEYSIDYWNEWLENQDYDSLQVEPNILISAEEDNKLVGTCGLRKIDNDTCQFNTLYVRKEYRNKGIGTKLFGMIEECAIKNKYKKIILTTDPNFKEAHKLFERKGYIFDSYNSTTEEFLYHKDI